MKNYLKYMCIFFISMIITLIPIKVNAISITLNKSEILLGPGYTETLKYTLESGLSSSNIVWTSSNKNVAIVQNGKVIGIAEGTTIITATINGEKATCKVTVSTNYITVTGIKLNKSKITLQAGGTETLKATITPSNATNKDVKWSSSNTSVVTVNSSGKITAKKAGTAIITASSSGFNATCEVTVTSTVSLKSIKINKSSLTLKENETEKLTITYTPSNATNKKINWRSSNTNVVTVDSSGKITAKKVGTATITAVSNDGGYVSTCKVTVEAISKKVTSVTLDKTELKMIAGENATLTATVNPNYAENKNVTWSSSDEKVVTVKDGKLTAIGAGTAEIKVITEDGNKEAICKITVTLPPLEEITFTDTEKRIYQNEEIYLKPTLKPSASVLENAIWTSSDENIATVENGKVKALAPGKTTITVSNEDKTLTASIEITVINKPQKTLNIIIEGYNLNFEPSKKNYTLRIQDEKELKINTNMDSEYVVIKGNENLKNGSVITIKVNYDEEETYTINIKKQGNYTIFFIIAIIILLAVNIIRLVNKKKKTQPKTS